MRWTSFSDVILCERRPSIKDNYFLSTPKEHDIYDLTGLYPKEDPPNEREALLTAR